MPFSITLVTTLVITLGITLGRAVGEDWGFAKLLWASSSSRPEQKSLGKWFSSWSLRISWPSSIMSWSLALSTLVVSSRSWILIAASQRTALQVVLALHIDWHSDILNNLLLAIDSLLRHRQLSESLEQGYHWSQLSWVIVLSRLSTIWQWASWPCSLWFSQSPSGVTPKGSVSPPSQSLVTDDLRWPHK